MRNLGITFLALLLGAAGSLACFAPPRPAFAQDLLLPADRPTTPRLIEPTQDASDEPGALPTRLPWTVDVEIEAASRSDSTVAPRWTELAPPARAEHVAVLDEQHDRLILFGGLVESGRPRADLWAFELQPNGGWKRLDARGAGPSPRYGAAAVYDASRRRMLVIGGLGASGASNEVWELTLGGEPSWEKLEPQGAAPSGRGFHSAVLDRDHDRVLVFGGSSNSTQGVMDDLWALELSGASAWKRLAPQGLKPRARAGHIAVLAPEHGGMILFGGTGLNAITPYLNEYLNLNDTWFLSTGDTPQWTEWTPRISGAAPPKSFGAVAMYDSRLEQVLVFGGNALAWQCWPMACGTGAREMPWVLSLRDLAWSQPTPTGLAPPIRAGAVAVLDRARHRWLVHGGELRPEYRGHSLSDLWAWDLVGAPAWARALPTSPGPLDRDNETAQDDIFDPVHGRVLRFTGSQLWERDARGAGDWVALEPRGERPPARAGHVVVRDSRRGRLIVCGGHRVGLGAGGYFFQEAWALPLNGPPEWTRIEAQGNPPALVGAVAIYDSLADRVVAIAPSRDFTTSADTVWQLSLGRTPSWSVLVFRPRGSRDWPFVGELASAVCDAKRNRMLLYGGGVPTSDDIVALRNTWALPLVEPHAWELLRTSNPPGEGPWGRMGHAAVYDAARDRMLVLGGYDPGASFAGPWNDVWALELSTPRWDKLRVDGGPIPTWVVPTAVADPTRSTVVVLEDGLAWVADLDGRSHDRPGGGPRPLAAVRPEASSEARLSWLEAHPNPFTGGLQCSFVLPAMAEGSIQLVDLMGRRRWSRDLAGLAPGAQAIAIEADPPLAPGVYILRLTHGGVSTSRKVVRLR